MSDQHAPTDTNWAVAVQIFCCGSATHGNVGVENSGSAVSHGEKAPGAWAASHGDGAPLARVRIAEAEEVENELLYGLAFGALMGALFGVGAYALTAGRRDFVSVSGLQAGGYDVMADVEVADEAAARLRAGGGPAPTDRQRTSTS